MSDTTAATGDKPATALMGDDVQARARLFGWTPKEEYAGPASAWVDAAPFVERMNKRFPRIFDSVDELARGQQSSARMIAELREEVQTTRATLDEMREFARTANDAGYQRALREANLRLKSAREAGDVDGTAAASADVATLETERALAPKVVPKKDEPPKRPEGAPTLSAEDAQTVTAWIGRNPWYRTDPRLGRLAEGTLTELNATRQDVTLAERLELVAEEVKAAYPERFGVPRKAATAPVLEPGSVIDTRPAGGRSFADLPPEAKAQFAKFAKQLSTPKRPYTEAEYLAQYRWD